MRRVVFFPLCLVGFLLMAGNDPAFGQVSDNVIISAAADIPTSTVNNIKREHCQWS